MPIPAKLSQEDIAAIAGGYHGDPFRVLGPHKMGDSLAIRAFLPQAAQATAVIDSQKFPMNKLHNEGFFELLLEKTSYSHEVDYEILLKTYAGDEILYNDPYRFPSPFSDYDKHLFVEGTLKRMYDHLGARPYEMKGCSGVYFSVWAPNAERVSLIGDFNNWDGRRHPLRFLQDAGIWELFVPGLSVGAHYKYEIQTSYQGYAVAKSDPVGFFSQLRPDTASIVWDIDQYEWQDSAWLEQRAVNQSVNSPISIYETHLGSWKLKNGWEWLSYQDMIQELIPYVKKMGFTHIELLPISEHPFDGSWGYQVTGYFAPTSRFGTPDDFMALVDACHQANIGVILDWVPAHFPTDQHGLGFFDGTHLYEHADPRKGAHPDWGTYIFNYGRNEVRQFLISNALFWLDKYHIDGLRVDAVASMLYLDFSRNPGEWLPNRYGGRENIEALVFLQRFNEQIHEEYPDVLTFAEESTSWPGVTRSAKDGGLGFDIKWNMGWMHDTLQYMRTEPIHRSYHHGSLTFSLLYAFSERFVLPFSHDEVVHLKKSMLDKMPGDLWQKFANLRLLYGYQWAHPGKKLLFMGGEIGQWREWSEDRSLDWHLLQQARHAGLQKYVEDLNEIYGRESALFAEDNSWEGYTWLDFRDSPHSILAFMRTNPANKEQVMIVCNFTPVVREGYRLGVPGAGQYAELLNSDKDIYGGSNVLNEGHFTAQEFAWHDMPYSIQITLPPLATIYFKLSKNVTTKPVKVQRT